MKLEPLLKEYRLVIKLNKNLSKNTISAYERDILDYLNFIKENYNCIDSRDLKSDYLKKYLNLQKMFLYQLILFLS